MAKLPEYFCIAPDLPEQGQSQSAGPFSMERAADSVTALIREQVSGGRATVVGLSEGAQVVVAMLSRCPEVIGRAFVSSALLRPLPGAGLLRPGVLAWAYRSMMAPFRNVDFWIRLNMKYSAGIPEQYYTEFKKGFQEMTEGGFVNLMAANASFRLPGGLDKAQSPALVVAGEREYAVMRQSALDLAAALPNARAYTLDLGPGSSLAKEHNWALTAPDLFARALRAWMEGAPLPRELTPTKG